MTFTTKITKDTKVSQNKFPNFVHFVSFVVNNPLQKRSICLKF
jgi:hypothetical protein